MLEVCLYQPLPHHLLLQNLCSFFPWALFFPLTYCFLSLTPSISELSSTEQPDLSFCPRCVFAQLFLVNELSSAGASEVLGCLSGRAEGVCPLSMTGRKMGISELICCKQ